MISVGFLAAAGYLFTPLLVYHLEVNLACYLILNIHRFSDYRVRVANELGAGSARKAKFAIKNVVLISFIIGSTLFVFFLLFRGKLAYVFTEDSNVAKAVSHLSPLLAFSILLNSVQPVLSGLCY